MSYLIFGVVFYILIIINFVPRSFQTICGITATFSLPINYLTTVAYMNLPGNSKETKIENLFINTDCISLTKQMDYINANFLIIGLHSKHRGNK